MGIKSHIFYFFMLVIFFTTSTLEGISLQERDILIDLYQATDGDQWANNDGWKEPPLHTDGFAMPGTEKDWFGIWVSGDNHVFSIGMDNNNLKGTIPKELGNLNTLTSLQFSDNPLDGSIPPELGNLSNLMYLNLSHNKLSGSIPSELGNLKSLKSISLNFNKLTGVIPSELGNLSNLEWIEFFGNQLSGSIPPELGNLKKLEYLSLGGNQLTGSIPAELGKLSNLEYLGFKYNQISGNIPPELGKLTNLKELELFETEVTGLIPITFGNLINLEELKLDNNQLTGNIPVELSNLSKLFFLNLSSNKLTGNIPYELGNLIDLIYFRLNNNLLSGPIPTSLMNLTKLNAPNVDLGNNCLYTNDNELELWLNEVDSDWNNNQCGNEKEPPFGSFDTPIDGTTVYSSIPVTGWALDDTSIESIKLYRELGEELIYIGDALFVEGARPDVAEAYPEYPNNNCAGWGYMMLTNFLPNGGNGIFVINAIATDVVGKSTLLGRKRINCDNFNAKKPFGAIDTPIQGGTASSNNFINWGWVLTPQPNNIPTNGTTIDVYVDGINLGNPIYNIYRADIAELFPGYANSNGAIGYFTLDTTSFSNGVHTIQWIAKDSAENSDGIGSRYFTVQNVRDSLFKKQNSDFNEMDVNNLELFLLSDNNDRIINELSPIKIWKGATSDINSELITSSGSGIFTIKIKELERLVIEFPKTTSLIKGFLKIGDNLHPLPIGSTLNKKTKKFFWQPGPGFTGGYSMVFFERGEDSQLKKKNIFIQIEPKFLY